MWIMGGRTAVKARNIAANPNVALHWQVTEAGERRGDVGNSSDPRRP